MHPHVSYKPNAPRRPVSWSPRSWRLVHRRRQRVEVERHHLGDHQGRDHRHRQHDASPRSPRVAAGNLGSNRTSQLGQPV